MNPVRRNKIRKTPKRTRGKDDFKNNLILVLLITVLIETFLLFRFVSPTSFFSAVRKVKIADNVRDILQSPNGPHASKIPRRRPQAAPLVGLGKPAQRHQTQKHDSPPTHGLSNTSVFRIAIIIDDSGYSEHDCQFLSSIETPVTVAILPNLEHSSEIAQCAHQNHKEVMLHLPLEPHQDPAQYPQGYIIKTSMDKERVIMNLGRFLKSVPFTVGVNNHMGSKATEDKRLMTIIFKELNKRHLFFVDSRVTNKSICPKLAYKLNLPFTQRDVFLDNENRRDYIEKQFAQLARLARKNGYAVGIGHARALTWQIVREQSELLAQEGFRLVTVQEIINSTP